MSRHHGAPTVEFSFEKNNKYNLQGLYKSNANTITMYLSEIETPFDLYEILEHEGIHAGLDSMDFIEEEEHSMIRAIMMATEDMY